MELAPGDMVSQDNYQIAFVRRGYSATGGAEAYLKRLARHIADNGHKVRLITTADWPASEWDIGEIAHLPGKSPRQFAVEVSNLSRPKGEILFSLERIHRCDIYRAGDGVHAEWLERKKRFETPMQKFARAFNRKHSQLLSLERSLLAERNAARVIVNSRMVRNQIVSRYDYPAGKIDIIYNGVPVDEFRAASIHREKIRQDLRIGREEVALLFVGSGWERKGLRFAVRALEEQNAPNVRLFVAGRGNQRDFKSDRVQFLGEVVNLPSLYAAGDVFILPTLYDPFSNACLEALASGLPVITTRGNGFAEIIEENVHGSILDSPENIAALGEAIRYWSDRTRQASAQSTSFARAAEFDISRNVEQTLRVIDQAASAASTSG